MFRRKLAAGSGQIEDVDRGLALGIDQRDVDVAFLLREDRADSVQEPWLVLRNDLD